MLFQLKNNGKIMVKILHEDIVCRHWSDSTDSINEHK